MRCCCLEKKKSWSGCLGGVCAYVCVCAATLSPSPWKGVENTRWQCALIIRYSCLEKKLVLIFGRGVCVCCVCATKLSPSPPKRVGYESWQCALIMSYCRLWKWVRHDFWEECVCLCACVLQSYHRLFQKVLTICVDNELLSPRKKELTMMFGRGVCVCVRVCCNAVAVASKKSWKCALTMSVDNELLSSWKKGWSWCWEGCVCVRVCVLQSCHRRLQKELVMKVDTTCW